MSIHKQNCLGFALEWWKKELEYKIWYNSDHAINIHKDTQVIFKGYREFIPLENFGLLSIYNSHKAQLSENEIELLVEYFCKYNKSSYIDFITNPPNDYSFISFKLVNLKRDKKKPLNYSDTPVGFFNLIEQKEYVTLIGAEPYIVICIDIDNVRKLARFVFKSKILGIQSHWYNLKDIEENIRYISPQNEK